ncbi:MAG: hypothetical protein IJY61_05230 [Candidatus Gastranaerophilales bacterium]|nr:hypothetical protein [Candidatus Gastranaerophilales bacterium]
MVDTVKFDPGMGEFVLDFNEYINDVYSQMMSLKTVHQKRARFKLYASKIERYMKNNISFYLGCLLWAYIIKTENEKAPKAIVGNTFLNMTQEQKDEFDYMIQVNFLENYFDSFERDTLYYIGKKQEIPADWKVILSLYSDFLELNNGFLSTKMTSDIKLPEKIAKIVFKQDINSVIQRAITDKNLETIIDTVKIS